MSSVLSAIRRGTASRLDRRGRAGRPATVRERTAHDGRGVPSAGNAFRFEDEGTRAVWPPIDGAATEARTR